MKKNEYQAVGMMSGTSMDGLDLAVCTYRIEEGVWQYQLKEAVTIPYSAEWHERLANASVMSGQELIVLDKAYGSYIGEQLKKFISAHHGQIDLIASHGHTIFHRPEEQLTYQIGDGRMIYASTGIPVVYDFRALDVALGGQGAPLVPVGDRMLFPTYAQCLNLGGFANISYEIEGHRVAFDICPVNMILNRLSEKSGKTYDEGGKMAKRGKVVEPLLACLNELPFYNQPFPKSLGREWFEREFYPYFTAENELTDLLRTAVEHIVIQLSAVIGNGPGEKILVTGGGAHNNFLIDLLRDRVAKEVVVPDRSTIDYKEALVFGFLGVLRLRNEVNTYASVTGATRDSSGGILVR